MLVSELIDGVEGHPIGAVHVNRVDIDSRVCEPGSLFFALNGTKARGTSFIADAVARGAVAVVVSEAVSPTVPVLVVPESQIHDLMVAASYRIVGGINGVRLVGVTGTNGKTSVTNFVAQLCSSLGVPSSTIGTLTNARTTPAAPDLARILHATRASWDRDGVVAMEVSSHALDQHRIETLHFEVSVFTNLTHDHLDYHRTMENYFEAKAQLFSPGRTDHAVICSDDAWGQRLVSQRPDAIGVATKDLSDVVVTDNAVSFTWRGHPVSARVGGQFNVTNVFLACEAALALGFAERDIANAASAIHAVPGRFEVVATSPLVIVDYAHTPDGLERVLRDVRVRTSGRVIAVFGCGGDRDHEKRPVMGSVSSRLADVVIITSDNSRSEDPVRIAAEIRGGCDGDADVHIELDRARVIDHAISIARQSDVVVIAGKGHEKTQETNGFVVDFDDVAVARERLNR